MPPEQTLALLCGTQSVMRLEHSTPGQATETGTWTDCLGIESHPKAYSAIGQKAVMSLKAICILKGSCLYVEKVLDASEPNQENKVKGPLQSWLSFDSKHFDAQFWVYFTGRVNKSSQWANYGEVRKERGKLYKVIWGCSLIALERQRYKNEF